MQSFPSFPSLKFAAAACAIALGSCGGGSGGSSAVAPTSLTYDSLDVVYEACADITTNNADVTGGSAITSWAVDPALPAGLEIDTTSGNLMGQPTVTAAQATYTVTAGNAAGSVSADLLIQVDAPPLPAALTYANADASYPTGVAITPNTPTVTGNITDWSVAPALPAGLMISPSSGTITGTPTAVSAQTTYTVTAEDCLGGSTTADIQITITDGGPVGGDAPRFAYATNSGDGTVSIYELDGNTGRFQLAGYELAGGAPTDLVASDDDSKLFVLDGAGDAVHVFTINTASGQLTELAGSPYALPAGSGASDIVLTPNGANLYCANTDLDSISAFDVAGSGALTAVAGSPFATAGDAPVVVTVSEAGTELFGACRDSNQLFAQDIGVGGVLSTEVLATTQTGPAAIETVDNNNNGSPIIYLGFTGSPTIQYFVFSAAGTLVALNNQGVNGTVAALRAATYPGGRILYAGNSGLNRVQRLSIADGGEITPITETPTVDGLLPVSIAISDDLSRAAIVYSGLNEISSTLIDGGDGGRLLPIQSGGEQLDRTRARTGVSEVVIVDGATTLSRTTSALLATNFSDDDVSQFSFDGVDLTAQATFMQAVGEGPNSVLVHPNLNRAYVVNNSDTMSADLQVWNLDSSGSLTGSPIDIDTGTPSNGTWSVHMGRSAKFLFAVNSDLTTSQILSYPVDAAGDLGVPTSVDAKVLSLGGAVDLTERYFYVANSGSNDVSAYTINATTGALSLIGDFAAGNSPSAIQVEASGRYLYVVNRGDGTISGFVIQGATGSLIPISGAGATVAAGVTPIELAIDAFGRHLFVANQGDATLGGYRINVNGSDAVPNGTLEIFGTTSVDTGQAPRALRFDAANTTLFVGTSDTGNVLSYGFADASGVLSLNDTESSGTDETRSLGTYPR